MLEGHEPDGDTQYRIGSLTKTFIAVLVMRLRDEGLLDLADPLGKHLDAGQAASATIAQLLSHTAGLASETPGPWWERSPGDLRPALADILGPARHPAGRLFHYSNPGYGLLGALVSQLRGHGWEKALRQEILDPLGMARTTVSPEAPHARGFAVHPWADVMQLEPAEGTGLMAPAGELWSTAADLCRFAAFLLDGDDRVLAAKTLAEMRAPASPPGDDAWASGYGLGLQLFRHDGRVFYGHSGSMPGFLATLCVSPADGLGGIALANATSGPDIAGIAIDLVTDRGRPRAARPGPLEAAARRRSGPARADRPVVLGTSALPAAAARRPRPGALAGGGKRPRLPLPCRARRHLDRPRRLLHGRDPPPSARR